MSEKTDWNRVWKEKIDAASWRKRPLGMSRGSCGSLVLAEQYHRDARLREQRNNQAVQVAKRLHLGERDTVVDIGPGTGTLTTAVSRYVKHVTAIEPSEAMLSVLKKNLRENRIKNIQCLHKRWEEVIPQVDAVPHDVVLASFSLTMRDIKASVEKMLALARKYVCLFTFVGNPAWDYEVLWPRLFGEDYFIGPDYMDLYLVLHSMGIRANVEIHRNEHTQTFESLEDAVEFWKHNISIHSPEDEKVVRSYLKGHLTEKEGRLCSEHDMQSAMIWWKKEG